MPIRLIYDIHSLPAALQSAGLTWANYGGYAFHYIKELAASPTNYSTEGRTMGQQAGAASG